MATPAQMTDDRATTRFGLLPHENPEEFTRLLASLREEHEPGTASEEFLVLEMARAQWKLRRAEAMETAVLSGAAGDDADPWAAIAREFAAGATSDALLKLDRYAGSARRAWHTSLQALTKLRAALDLADERESRVRRNIAEAEVNAILAAPIPMPPPPPPPAEKPKCETKPLPAHLERELAAHKRRDPLFDPKYDASQMSRELRKWFEAA